MMMSPGILALLGTSAVIAAHGLYAAGAGLRILGGWNPASAAEGQLRRERQTHLLTALGQLLLAAEVLTLLLFVALADRLHPFFTGAMCATGTLNANAYGYPALLLTLAGTIGCSLWVAVNRLDAPIPNSTHLRVKYFCLVPIALLLATQTVLVFCFFRGLQPTLLTSCCGTVFGEGASGMGAGLAHLSSGWMRPLLWGLWAATLVAGLYPRGHGLGERLYAGLSALMLPVGIAAILSFVSVSIYDLPTHHCPFCLLQKEYHYAGYPLYAGLLLGTVPGMGVGLIRWCGRRATLDAPAGRMAARLRRWSLAGYALFGVTAAWPSFRAGLLIVFVPLEHI